MCTPVPQLYEIFGLLLIEKLYSFQVLLLMFKCIHCSYLVPSAHIDRFVINSEVHNYNTRSSQNLHLFNTRTSYEQRCIKYKGSSLWNSLPMPLRLCSSIAVFKGMLKITYGNCETQNVEININPLIS